MNLIIKKCKFEKHIICINDETEVNEVMEEREIQACKLK